MPFDFWEYVIYDIEKTLHYSEEEILRWNMEKAIKKYVIIKNDEHMANERDTYIRYSFSINNDGKDKFKKTPLPFTEKKEKYNKKNWKENAPKYNLSDLQNLL